MEAMQWYAMFWQRAFDFSGRSRRSEYWYPILFNFIIGLILGFLGMGILSGLFGFATLIPGLAVSFRRMHDVGRSAWWLLLYFTGIGWFVILFFAILDSQPGGNQWGANPKG